MIEQIIAAVREAGKIVLSASDIERATSEKGVGNFVTKYDVAVQEYLRGALLAILPEAHFMGEEGREHEDSLHGLCFIVDPIDGTANFVRGLCCSAISVALARDGELIAGVVYQPYIDEIFYAEKGKGAFRNGQPIHASDRPMKDGLYYLGTGSYYQETYDRTFAIARALFDRMLDLRRFGPAAFELCNIACGRLELGFETLLQPWDYAAAACILHEAGGVITQLDGSPITLDRGCSILAGNRPCHAEFLAEGLHKL